MKIPVRQRFQASSSLFGMRKPDNSSLLVSIPEIRVRDKPALETDFGVLLSRSVVQEANVLVVRSPAIRCAVWHQFLCGEIFLAYDVFVSPLQVS